MKIILRNVLFALGLFLGSAPGYAETLYWNGADGAWATTAAKWSSDSSSTGTLYWVNNDDAVITSTTPTINLTTATVGSLVIQNGATFSSSGSTGHILSVTGAGSGNFSMTDNSTSNAYMKIYLQGSSEWVGRITVNSFTNASSQLVLGTGAASSTDTTTAVGTGVDTKITMNGGNLVLGFGALNAGTGGTATIGELSGTGTIGILTHSSSGGKTRTLEVNQATNTTFRGTIGTDVASNYSSNYMGLAKSGTGTLIVTSSSGSRSDSGGAYAGTTTVSGGKLYFVGNYGSGFTYVSGQGNYVVKSGATLGFDGTLTFASTASRTITVESGGILDPGQQDAAGTWTIAGGNSSSLGLTFLGNATIQFRLGPTQDQIILTNTSMIGSASGGTGSILFDLTTYGATIGTTYDLISFGGTTQGISLDTFALSQTSINAGWAGTFGYGGGGNLLQFTVTAVPEPSQMALLVLGGAALAMRLRRRPQYTA